MQGASKAAPKYTVTLLVTVSNNEYVCVYDGVLVSCALQSARALRRGMRLMRMQKGRWSGNAHKDRSDLHKATRLCQQQQQQATKPDQVTARQYVLQVQAGTDAVAAA